jgi:type I restriction enzyme S subunit
MSDTQYHEVFNLGQLAHVRGRIGWKGLKSHEYTDAGPYLVAGTHIRGDKIQWDRCQHINEFRYDESPEIKLNLKDIIISKDGTIGRIALVDYMPGPTTINSTMMLVRLKGQELLCSEFIFYFLQGEKFKKLVAERVAGSGVPHLFQADMKTLTVFAPSLPKQQKIAKILSTVDNLIEKTQTLIEKYTAIKQGMMADLFTRGIDMTTGDTPNSKGGKLRPSVEDAPELYKQTELGWVPKEWEVKCLEDLLAETPSAMRSGPFGSSLLKHELVEKGIPLLGIDNIFVERFSGTYRRFVTQEKFNELSKYAVRSNDVVITIMGTVGRCCVIPDDIEKALSSKHLWTMTFDKQKVISDLVCWQLNYADWAKSWFHQKSQGGIMEAIQSSTLKNLLLPVPKLDEQLKIAEIYRSLCAKIEKEQAYLDKLSLKKKGLMQDLLTGKVTVGN